MTNGFVHLILLGCDHPQIVPGFRIFRPQSYRLFEIGACLREIVFAQEESAKIVMGFSILGLCSDNLLERLSCMIKVSVLKERYAVGEIITSELPVVELSREGK